MTLVLSEKSRGFRTSHLSVMKSALIAAAVLVLSAPAQAQIDPKVKAECMKAQDFVGCAKALSGGVSVEPLDELDPLRNAMKQVAARLSYGTSLRDSTLAFQPVTDNLALVQQKYPDSLAVRSASKASALFDTLQWAWQARINSLTVTQYLTIYSCEPTKNGVDRFNSIVGSTAINYSVTGGGLFGITVGCQESVGLGHESMMMSFIAGVLNEGSVSPAAISKYEADRAEQIRTANMEAWEKYLENNPNKKAWAAANPAMAAKERDKYNLKNPVRQVSIPSYSQTLRYLSYFRPSLTD